MGASTEKAVKNAENFITVRASTEQVQVVTEYVENIMSGYDAPMKAVIQVNIAIDEIFSNIVKFAYADPETGKNNDGEATVSVSPVKDGGAITGIRLEFIDGGNPYNPLLHEDPLTNLPIEERDVGGLGILIVRKQMDDVEYRYENECNILTITKMF